jgi:hypothetical protein
VPDPLGASQLRGRPVGGGPTLYERRHTAPRLIDLQLKEDQHRLPPDNGVARLCAHRRALRDYIHRLDDPSAQSLLHSVLAVEAREAEAREAAQKQQRMHAQMQLTCEKLRRQLGATAARSSFPTSPVRSRSAAVDLEADIPPGLDDDAVES